MHNYFVIHSIAGLVHLYKGEMLIPVLSFHDIMFRSLSKAILAYAATNVM